PVALKIQANEVLHKSDVGGVMLNISSEDEVRLSFETIMENMGGSASNSAIDGILVSPMRPAGIELLVGITRDAAWGQALVVGLGGSLTEVLNDTTVRVLPIKRDEITRMLSELRSAGLLLGGRGQPPINMEHLVDIIFRISRVAQGLQDHLDALEINPLLLHGSSIEALDVLVTWQR
ncbi:MAG TPA: acetate--CoA ligase family protein, partial [Ktedonobacteraceae bacterium]